MSTRLWLVVCLFPVLGLAASAQNWQQGPVGNRHDLTPSATAQAQLASGRVLVSGQAQAFMACKREDNGGRTFELRFSAPPFAGYNPASSPATTQIVIDGDSHTAHAMSFLVQNRAFFAVEPDPATVRTIAGIAEDRSATLVFNFVSSGRNFSFITTLGHPDAAVLEVLNACGIPAAAPGPARAAAAQVSPADMYPASAAAGRSKFVVDGVSLGMTEQQVLAALKKAGGADHFVLNRAGFPTAKTPAVTFYDFQFLASGRLSSFHFGAPNPRRLKEAKTGGPTYDLAVRFFGPPEGPTNNGVRWGRENSGKEFADYEIGDPGDPSEVWVDDGIIRN